MTWPGGGLVAPLVVAGPYQIRSAIDRAAFRRVQASIGFALNASTWARLCADLAGAGMVFVEARDSAEPVAVAAAERRAGGWVELGWVTVAPDHRGRGLGRTVCTALIQRSLRAGETRLCLSTQDHRLAALRIYLQLGFLPLSRPGKRDRWRDVCGLLGVTFAPETWGWPPG